MMDVDDYEWAAAVAKIEAAFQNLEKKGLVVASGKRWAPRSGCWQTVYETAPGVTDEDYRALCNVPMASA